MKDLQEASETKVKDLILKTEALLDKSDNFLKIGVRGFSSDSLMEFKVFDDNKLAAIADRMPEINRATNAFGRKNSQTMGKMMTLNMISFSPYSRIKQCLAQIENKRTALKENIFKLQKEKIRLEKLVWQRDLYKAKMESETDPEVVMDYKFKIDLTDVDIQKKSAGISDTTLYIEGCLKEIGMYQKTYEEIRKNNDIPEKWDEEDFEKGEIEHHLKTAFLHLIRDIQMTGRINVGTSEYLEQFGVNPQTAELLVNNYLQEIKNLHMNGNGQMVTINVLYDFLEKAYQTFKDAHKQVLQEMGLENLIHEDFLYLEGDKDGSE